MTLKTRIEQELDPYLIEIDNGLLEMNLKKGSTIQIIEAGINGGHIEVTMANDASRRGAMNFIIFKVPDTTVRK